MTTPDRNYEDMLRRVLHSTLDPVEPTGDGLAKIHNRIAEPWLKRRAFSLRHEIAALGWLVLVRCESFGHWIKAGFPGAPGHRDGSSRRGALGPAVAWLRPALAVAGAVVLVVTGVFALGQIQPFVISPTGNSPGGGPPAPGVSSPAGPGGRAQSAGATTAGGSPGNRSPGGSHSRSSAKASSRASSAPGSPTPSPSPSTSPSPTPTTPTPTPTTPTPTPTTPTPTPTTQTFGPDGGDAG